MPTYTPSEEELIDMSEGHVLIRYQIEQERRDFGIRIGKGVHCKEILYWEGEWYDRTTPEIYNKIYPTSRKDIETLISLFSPNE